MEEEKFGDWRDSAACKTAGERLADCFFSLDEDDKQLAKMLCYSCPVREECLEYALTKPERYGIWGGMDEAARERLRRSVRRSGGSFTRRDVSVGMRQERMAL